MRDKVEEFVAKHCSIQTAMLRIAENHEENAKHLRRVVGRYEAVDAPPQMRLAVTQDDADEATTSGSTSSVPMLYGAAKEYLDAINEKPLSNTVKRRKAEVIEALKSYRTDVAWSEIDRIWLERLTDYIKSRPEKRRLSKQEQIEKKKLGTKFCIAPGTVKTLLQHLREFFDWVDSASDSDTFGHWEAPKKWQRLFDVDLDQIRTKTERDAAADGPVQIKPEELVKLYRSIDPDNDQHKAWFLSGLFTAQGQKELSVTAISEFDLDASTCKHRRNKTGQLGCYWLPPELVTLLRKMFSNKAPADLAFTTTKGSPLVTDKSDAVRQAFEDWEARAEITLPKGVGFYGLRRYFGDKAERLNISLETALSQKAQTVGRKHYTGFRDFDGVAEVGRAIYAELKAAGMFEPKKASQVDKVCA